MSLDSDSDNLHEKNIWKNDFFKSLYLYLFLKHAKYLNIIHPGQDGHSGLPVGLAVEPGDKTNFREVDPLGCAGM